MRAALRGLAPNRPVLRSVEVELKPTAPRVDPEGRGDERAQDRRLRRLTRGAIDQRLDDQARGDDFADLGDERRGFDAARIRLPCCHCSCTWMSVTAAPTTGLSDASVTPAAAY